MTREEKDFLGTVAVPADALYGIHTARALANFPLSGRPVDADLVKAFGWVKLACLNVNVRLGFWPDQTHARAVEQACLEMAGGRLGEHVVVDALQGGAGTSTNMNVNEVLANRALDILGLERGSYDCISPLDHINRHQSTNDTYPSALKLAALRLLEELEDQLVALQEAFQAKEREFADVVKVGRTQLQDAVLITLGREMGAYAEALGRDRWRVFKCRERLRVLNLGGTAVGTGLGAPREFVFSVIDELRSLTGMNLARAENLLEATQNADVFVEVAGMLNALAATLLKCANDLRLLASGPQAGLAEISLPPQQAGSSIMPGKVNPVIPEAVAQAALVVLSSGQALTTAAALGNLELNQFMPLIADELLSSIKLLTRACRIFRERCVCGIQANRDVCRRNAETSTAAATALVSALGYERAAYIARIAHAENRSIKEVALQLAALTEEQFAELTSAEAVMRLGTSGGTT